MSSHILPLPTFSDGDPSCHPPQRQDSQDLNYVNYFYSPPPSEQRLVRFLSKVAELVWKELPDHMRSGVDQKCSLKELPVGYKYFLHLKSQKDPNSKCRKLLNKSFNAELPFDTTGIRCDPYVFGHPSGRRFRSTIEIIPHFVWLYTDPEHNPANCKCTLCPNFRSSNSPFSTLSQSSTSEIKTPKSNGKISDKQTSGIKREGSQNMKSVKRLKYNSTPSTSSKTTFTSLENLANALNKNLVGSNSTLFKQTGAPRISRPVWDSTVYHGALKWKLNAGIFAGTSIYKGWRGPMLSNSSLWFDIVATPHKKLLPTCGLRDFRDSEKLDIISSLPKEITISGTIPQQESKNILTSITGSSFAFMDCWTMIIEPASDKKGKHFFKKLHQFLKLTERGCIGKTTVLGFILFDVKGVLNGIFVRLHPNAVYTKKFFELFQNAYSNPLFDSDLVGSKESATSLEPKKNDSIIPVTNFTMTNPSPRYISKPTSVPPSTSSPNNSKCMVFSSSPNAVVKKDDSVILPPMPITSLSRQVKCFNISSKRRAWVTIGLGDTIDQIVTNIISAFKSSPTVSTPSAISLGYMDKTTMEFIKVSEDSNNIANIYLKAATIIVNISSKE